MKIPSSVLRFATTDEQLSVYKMFADYYRHYLNITNKKSYDVHTKGEDGRVISFEEKEAQMNEALKKEILRVSGQTISGMPEGAYMTNPMIQWATFAVVSAMIDMILPETLIESIGLYTDVKVGDWGDSFSFEVKPRDLFVVSKSGHAKRTSEIHKQFNGLVTAIPEPHQITVGVSLYRVLAGKESLAEFVTKAVRSIEVQMQLDVYNAFATAMAALPTTASTGLKVSGYSQSDLISLCQRVSGWNAGQKAVVVGTNLALVNVLPTDANYRYDLESEFVKLGHIRQFGGYDIFELPQVMDFTTPFGTVISNSYLWILSPSSQKILKLCIEGSTLANTTQPFDAANLTQSSTLIKNWAVAVATNSVAGAIAL